MTALSSPGRRKDRAPDLSPEWAGWGLSTMTDELREFFRECQKRGVAARLAKSTPEERQTHARKMSAARWKKYRQTKNKP